MKRSSLLFLIVACLGILRVDGQSFWTASDGPYGGTINDLVVHSSGAMITATSNGVYRSTDGGGTWTRQAVGTDNVFLDLDIDSSGKIYVASNTVRIYLSTDAGATWSQLVSTGLLSASRKIEVAPNGNIYVSDALNRIMTSTNGGALFTNTFTFSSTINDLEVAANNNLYVATSALGVRVSSDGISFTACSGLSPTALVYSIAINGTVIWALASDAPYKGATNSTVYASVKGALPDATFSGVIDFDSSTGTVYIANNVSGKVYSNTNPGVSAWSAGVPYVYTFSATASYFSSATTWYLGHSNYGLAKTVNTGVAWSTASKGIKALPATNSMFASPTVNTFFSCWSTGFGYFGSSDDGATWTLNASVAANTYRALNGMIKLVDNSILAYGNGAIRSTSNGASWTVQNAAQILPQVVSTDGTNLYSYSGTSLLKSNSQGITWTPTAITGLPGTPTKIQVDGSGNVYFLTGGTKIFKVLSAGTTATELTALTALASSVNDFQVVSNVIYVLGNSSTLLTSATGGASFTSKNTPASSSNLWVYDSKNMFIQGSVGNFYISHDGGGIWANQVLVDAQARVTDMTVGYNYKAYLATTNSVAHKSKTKVILPLAPTALSVIGTGFDQVQLKWTDNAPNEDYYRIEQSLGDNAHYDSVAYRTGTTTNQGFVTITRPALTKNTTYFFRVVAVSTAGASAYSNEVSTTTLNQCATTIPNNRSWTATSVTDAGTPSGPGPFISNNVNISTVTGVPNEYHLSAFASQINPDGDLGDTYFIESCGQTVMEEYSALGNGAGTWNGTNQIVLKWQNYYDYTFFQGTTTLTLNATDPIPAAPTLNAYLYSSTEVLLNWNKTAFETQYVIERGPTGGPYVSIATISYPTVTYVDKNLTTGNSYYYRIYAKNLAGTSGPSPEAGISLVNVLFRPVENAINLNFENQQGVSWGDLDGDGDEDIASPSFTNNAGQSVPPVFYENMGNGKDFTRRDLAVLADENTAVSRGINLFDFNNDGKLDMYITRSGPFISDLLLINNGAWDFTKTTLTQTQAPVNIAFHSSAILDFDHDGRADVFLGVEDGTFGQRNRLFRNVGGTSFDEIVTGNLVTDLGNSRGVSTADYDNDGDQDIFVLNSYSGAQTPVPNRLYKNNGDGTFTRVTGLIFDVDLFPQVREMSWGDIDNDADLDLYVASQSTAIGTPIADRLYQNNGNGTFTSLASPVAETATGTFGSTFGDIDNDGDLDLIVVNSGANSIFINGGSGTFTKYTGTTEMITHPNIFEIGGALADFDKDGFLDFYPAKGQTGTVDLPNFLYKNTLTPSASRNYIEIRLEGVASNKSALGARIKVTTTSPARTQIREVSSFTGYGSQNSLIQHFGLGTATTISQLQIKWPSGNVMTMNNVAANQILLIKEDILGPTLTLAPLNAASTASVSNPLTISVADSSTPPPVSAVSGKKITLATTANPGTPVQIWDATDGTLTGATFSFALTTNLAYLTQYSVTVDGGAFIDKYQNPSAAIAPAGWTFTTRDVPDMTPPVFDPFTAPQVVPKGEAATHAGFMVTATDNITAVRMFHRKVSQTAFTSSLGSPGTGNTYLFSLQDAYFDDMGIEYYFKAYDAEPNQTRSPADSTYYFTRTAFNNTNTGISVTAGGGANDYQIIAVPFDLPSKQPQFIFEEFGEPDKTKWRLLKYQDTPKAWIDYPSSSFSDINQGEGYFINSREGHNLAFGNEANDDNVKAPANTQGSLFTLTMKKGWNLIGNPYTLKIFWDDSRISGIGPLRVYSGGTYIDAPNNGELDRLKGGFVLADNAGPVQVKLNVTAQGGRKGFDPPPTDISQKYWIAPLRVEQQGLKYTLGGIGMNPTALLTKDDYDDVNPPRLFDYLEVNFDHPEYFLKKFSRDVVPTQDEYTWTFEVESNLEGEAELTWDNTAFGINDKELYLFDVAQQKPVDMRSLSRYRFSPKQSTHFRIYYGVNLESKIKPDRVLLGKAFPNPSSGVTSIPFTLPGQTATMRVKLEVYDLLGNKVVTLADGEFAPGFYTAEWNSSGSPMSDGLYVYRMVVADQNKNVVQTGKVVLRK